MLNYNECICQWGSVSQGNAKSRPKSLSVATKLEPKDHRHIHPRKSSLHQPRKTQLRRALPPHSASCAAGLLGICSFSQPSVPFVQAVCDEPENYNSQSAPGWRAHAAVTTVAEKTRRGSALWSGAPWAGGGLRGAGAAAEENGEWVRHFPLGSPQR